jgi:signal recognition particle GTPase
MLSFLKGRSEGEKNGWFDRLKQGLAKTRQQLNTRLSGLFSPGRKLDEELYDELETVLLVADVGVAATNDLLATLRARARREHYARHCSTCCGPSQSRSTSARIAPS